MAKTNKEQTHVTYDFAPKMWRVWKIGDYLEIRAHYKSLEANGVDWCEYYNDYMRDLESVALGVFKTRREARAYIESIGGTWK